MYAFRSGNSPEWMGTGGPQQSWTASLQCQQSWRRQVDRTVQIVPQSGWRGCHLRQRNGGDLELVTTNHWQWITETNSLVLSIILCLQTTEHGKRLFIVCFLNSFIIVLKIKMGYFVFAALLPHGVMSCFSAIRTYTILFNTHNTWSILSEKPHFHFEDWVVNWKLLYSRKMYQKLLSPMNENHQYETHTHKKISL